MRILALLPLLFAVELSRPSPEIPLWRGPYFEEPDASFIVPLATTCTSEAELETIIETAKRQGPFASINTYERIRHTAGAAREPDCKVVWIKNLSAGGSYHKSYRFVEMLPGYLSHIVIIQTWYQTERRVVFAAIEWRLGQGNSI